MLSKKSMGAGAILMAVLIAATRALGWSGSLHYLWALLVLVWGLKTLSNK